MEFTLECTSTVTGSGNTTQCEGDNLLGIRYKLVEDKATNFTTESTPTFAELVAVMTSGYDTVEGNISSPSDIVPFGGTDQDGNTVPNGGFYTDNATPLMDAAATPLTNHLNMILVLESATGGEFIYFNIDLAAIVQ